VNTLDELEAIRARHEALEALGHLAHHDWASEAHTDRATLLRLLDAAREELDKEQVSHLKTRVMLTRSREAAEPFVETLEADIGSEEEDEDLFRPVARHTNCAPLLTVGHFRRLAAALTRAQGESS
jgi:predicted DNA-binding protein (UPF0251 family)